MACLCKGQRKAERDPGSSGKCYFSICLRAYSVECGAHLCELEIFQSWPGTIVGTTASRRHAQACKGAGLPPRTALADSSLGCKLLPANAGLSPLGLRIRQEYPGNREEVGLYLPKPAGRGRGLPGRVGCNIRSAANQERDTLYLNSVFSQITEGRPVPALSLLSFPTLPFHCFPRCPNEHIPLVSGQVLWP